MSDESEDPRRVGRDEMNLCEFPIALLTERVPPGFKTMVFEDRHGTLTVTGSDAYGLPTAPDSDVIVGLIQLTKTAERLHRPHGGVHPVRAPEAAGLARQGRNYRRLERVAPSLGRRDAALRRLLVGQQTTSAGSTPASTSSTRWSWTGRPRTLGRGSNLCVLHLEQDLLQELPGQQPQAARPRHLLRAEERRQQAALSVPRQAVLPPARVDLRPPRSWPTSTSG